MSEEDQLGRSDVKRRIDEVNCCGDTRVIHAISLSRHEQGKLHDNASNREVVGRRRKKDITCMAHQNKQEEHTSKRDKRTNKKRVHVRE
jgi:hypothetical protein